MLFMTLHGSNKNMLRIDFLRFHHFWFQAVFVTNRLSVKSPSFPLCQRGTIPHAAIDMWSMIRIIVVGYSLILKKDLGVLRVLARENQSFLFNFNLRI